MLGRDDLAGPLEKILHHVLLQDANVEILTLLLALSDRPIDGERFDEQKIIVEEAQPKGYTWEQIIAEEPLVGDHWLEPNYSGSEGEEDWVYKPKTPDIVENSTPIETQKIVGVKVDQIVLKSTEEFLNQQYWSRRRKYAVIRGDYPLDFDAEGIICRLLKYLT